MTWNYRVVRKAGDFNGEPWESFGVHEVYYGKNKKINSVSVEPCYPYGETFSELQKDTISFLKAFLEPILEYDQIT